MTCDDPVHKRPWNKWVDSCTLDGLFYPDGQTAGVDAELITTAGADYVTDLPTVVPEHHGSGTLAAYVPGSHAWIRPVAWTPGGLALGVGWLFFVGRRADDWRRRGRLPVDGRRHAR